MNDFLTDVQATPLADWVLSSSYGYYVLLTGHAVGMGVVVGSVAMLCIRVLGFSREQPIRQFNGLLKLAGAGFALNAATGLTLFIANGPNLVKNPPFLTKLTCIAFGGACLWALWRRLASEQAVMSQSGGTASFQAKLLACATLSFWIFAIMAGRLIAYTIDY